MTIHSDFIAEVVSITEVSDNCEGRVNFVLNRFEDYPSILIQRLSDSRSLYYANQLNNRELVYQIDIYSTSYADLIEVSEGILGHFQAYTGNLNNNPDSFVRQCNAELLVETFEDDKPKILRHIIEVTLTAI